MLIARALLLDIRLLVADEIISMLDASTRIDVLNLLGDLKARGLGDPLHHPRPLARQLHQRPHGDHAPRRRRRDGRDRARLRQPAAPVHEDAARVGAAAAHEVEGRRRRRRRLPRSTTAPAAGELVEVEDDHFVASVATSMTQRRVTTPRTRRRRAGGHPVGGAAGRVERRRLALEPQPDHPARPDPAREQHLQLGRRAVRRRLRRRLPRRRHAPRR